MCDLYPRQHRRTTYKRPVPAGTEKALTEFAEHNDYTIVGYYADEGISARKPMKHRHGLLQLLEDVKHDKIDMILVTKLDRW